MPNLADIVVKKADGTTNVTYTGIVASAGDKSEALWRDTTAGAAPALQPNLRVRSQWNGPRTVRRVEGTFAYPVTYTDTTTALVAVQGTLIGTFTVQLPSTLNQVYANELAAQFGNLLASSLMKAVNSTGFAPT